MKKGIVLIFVLLVGCKYYSFTGASIPEGAETVQVNFFVNNAANEVGSVFEPGLDRDFTNAVQEMLLNQTNLDLTNVNGNLIYEGEIVTYRVTPMTATAQETAAQNRLTVTINVRFVNKLIEKDDFEKQFSFYSDFDANAQLTGGVLEAALDEIIERITQDIFNASVAKW